MIEAELRQTGSAPPEVVLLHLGAEGLELHLPDQSRDAQALRYWAYPQLQPDWDAAGQKLLIRHGSQSLSVADLGIVEMLEPWLSLAQQQAFKAQLKHSRSRRSLRSLLVLIFVLIGLLGLSSLSLLFWGRDWLAQNIPPALEQELGKAAYLAMLAETPPCEGKHLQAGIEQIANRLKAALAADTPYQLRYQVLKSQDINAFAIPGGQIGLNAALVAKVDTPEALAGVMAHEAQHVLLRHSLKDLLNRLGLGLILQMLLGDIGTATATLAQIGSGLLELDFSRHQESEADLQGLALLERARINPAGLPEFFRLLQAQEAQGLKVPAFLSTHPLSSERLEQMQAAMARLPQRSYQGFELDWPLIQSEASDCLAGK